MLLTMLPLITAAAQPDKKTLCPEVKIEAERLSDLTIPRAGHELFYVNGEFVVAGGHTNGFVPTPTAEYYKDGKWHQMQMVYNHDYGFSVVLESGKVLLGGGCEQPIGIGQTYLAELYDPVSHTFNGFGSMEQKRTGATGLELDSGKVVISGNWYHNDGIEVYNGQKQFTYIKDATIGRSHPYILRTAKDDAIIFGTEGIKGDTIQWTADRLKGDTLHIPFFEKWHPMNVSHHRNAESFIGDEAKGLYAYLIPVIDSIGQVAIAKVENGEFSLLPTTCPVPMQSQWEPIFYSLPVIVDQKAGRGYMIGISGDFRSNPEKANRYYILCIDYAQAIEGQPAPLTLYYTDPLPTICDTPPILDENGNLLIAGGMLHHSNFTPSAYVWLLHVGQQPAKAAEAISPWKMLLLVLAIVAITLAAWLWRRKRHTPETVITEEHPTQADEEADPSDEANIELMRRMRELMETRKLFQNSNLKLNDLAIALHTNRNYISKCISNVRPDYTFAQFINEYRLEYAKKLILNNPERKINEIFLEAGFSNEQTFYRIFKISTGMTPKEWKEAQSV
ncbi:MAG: helix-turn-helix domain-containing protein [Prevotella sp.]|nr:helix-turn-helix domain-containing protein [Prevotella sp.]